MTDISTIKASERTIDILHPASGEPLGVRVTLFSIDDERMKKAKRAIQDRKLHLEARGKNFKAEEIEENLNNLLFIAMGGWEWYDPTGGKEPATFNGAVPDFNRKNVIAVLNDLPWFADQINDVVGDTKAFFTR